MTQTELAEKVGVKYSAIHKYESGMVVNLKRDTIAALASALNVRPSWLMCMDNDSETPVKNSNETDLEEKELIRCWRLATDEQRQTIAFILRDYGMPFPKASEENKASLSNGA